MNLRCKWLALLLALLLLPLPVMAAEGTVEIYTAQQLAAIADDPAGSYVLMADLDMTGIAWKGLDFTGTFDGNGHIIANLCPQLPGDTLEPSYDGNSKPYDTTYYGLFATLKGAQVRNLQLLNVRAVVESDVPVFLAGLAGYSLDSTITNCTVTGCLELRAHDRMFGVAGMVGYGSGTVENCTVDVTLICTDTDRTTKDEQFMAAVFATGFMDVLGCTVNIDGYSSEYGYAHNGGITGMYMQYPLGAGKRGKLMGNTVTGKISFFEWNNDRRAYCAAEAGEVLAYAKDIKDNTCDFIRDEHKEYDTELRPEMCENAVYSEAVTPFACGKPGYTEFTCKTCGYRYKDNYTLPDHTLSEWTVSVPATVEAVGVEEASCTGCGFRFTRELEKLPPPETTVPAETEPAPSQRAAAPQWLLPALGGTALLAAAVLVLMLKKRK